MQLVGLNRRYVILGGLAIATIWLWSARSDQELPQSVQWAIGRPQSTPQNDAFDFPVLDSWELREICSSTEWNSSLVFTCDNNAGGVGHVRNSILNCVRYAIGAGGALVLPKIALRETDEMEPAHEEAPKATAERRHESKKEGIEYMFDKNHFVDSLKLSCPELLLIRNMEQTTSNRRAILQPERLFENIPTTGIEHPEKWSEKLHAWIQKFMSPVPEAEPIIVDLAQSFLHYPTQSDGRGLAHNFGSILKIRPSIRRIATAVLKDLASRHALQSFDLHAAIINPSFIGVHLATEDPLLSERHEVDVQYSHFAAQAAAYVEQATMSKVSIMYVASGNPSEIKQLATEASKRNVIVTHKEDLLSGKWKDELEKLTWDQRALVDYLVLLKGQEFAGVGHSSFSWNVYLKRHDNGDGLSASLDQTGVYRDGLSTLYGVKSSYVESSGCMWP